jgi:hypothetical protein
LNIEAAESKRKRKSVDIAKRAPGQRGPVWWMVGGRNIDRHMAKNTGTTALALKRGLILPVGRPLALADFRSGKLP